MDRETAAILDSVKATIAASERLLLERFADVREKIEEIARDYRALAPRVAALERRQSEDSGRRSSGQWAWGTVLAVVSALAAVGAMVAAFLR